MDWDAAVARGRTLFTRSESDQWDLAKLTAEVIAANGRGSARRWAADLGVSEPHVSKLKAVWEQYGRNLSGPKDSWPVFADCYALVGTPPAERRGLERKAKRNGRRVSSEERVTRPRDRERAFRESVEDQKFLRKMLANARIWKRVEPEARRRMGREKPERSVETARGPLALREQVILELQALLDGGLPKARRKPALVALADVETLLDWMRSFVATGDRSFEDAFEALVSGEAVTPPSDRRTKKKAGDVPVVSLPPSEPGPEEERPRKGRERRAPEEDRPRRRAQRAS